jgi:adenylosuccinate lyase
MIPRYTRPEMGALWTEQAKFEQWLEVEIAHCRALEETGRIPKDDLDVIMVKSSIDLERILEIERTTQHDVIAFLEAVGEKVGPPARWIHLGLTSTDIVDTAQALTIRRAMDLVIKDAEAFAAALKTQAARLKHLVCLGRTHGIHAEPTTYGLKFAVWWDEMNRNLERLRASRKRLAVGKLSGAVGTYSETTPELEALAMKHLGLEPALVATQVLQRDLHAEALGVLAVLGGTLEKIAIEIRHLQRTEVAEAAEPFAAGQKGSSAMPHKRNPVVCERVTGLARVLRSNAGVAFENQALWHERDISHSSTERIVLADSFILADYMLAKMTWVIEGLSVNDERVAANLASSRGLIHSAKILSALMKAGAARNVAYKWVQSAAMKVLDQGGEFLGRLKDEAWPVEGERCPLTGEQLAELCDNKALLGMADVIFKRLGMES